MVSLLQYFKNCHENSRLLPQDKLLVWWDVVFLKKLRPMFCFFLLLLLYFASILKTAVGCGTSLYFCTNIDWNFYIRCHTFWGFAIFIASVFVSDKCLIFIFYKHCWWKRRTCTFPNYTIPRNLSWPHWWSAYTR